MDYTQGRRHEFEGGVNVLEGRGGQYSKNTKFEKVRGACMTPPAPTVVPPEFIPV